MRLALGQTQDLVNRLLVQRRDKQVEPGIPVKLLYQPVLAKTAGAEVPGLEVTLQIPGRLVGTGLLGGTGTRQVVQVATVHIGIVKVNILPPASLPDQVLGQLGQEGGAVEQVGQEPKV